MPVAHHRWWYAAPEPVVVVRASEPWLCCRRPITSATAMWPWRCTPRNCVCWRIRCWSRCCANGGCNSISERRPSARRVVLTAQLSITTTHECPLALLQLVSPALPVGAFSYSEGLEVLVQRGQLRSPQDVGDWLEAELRQGVVRLETAALEPMQQCLQQWQTGADAELSAASRSRWLASGATRSLGAAPATAPDGPLTVATAR